MTLSNEQVSAVAYSLGHRSLGVQSLNSDRHRWSCACGYVSRNRRTYRLAIEAAVHHLNSVSAEALRNGYQLPTMRTRPEDESPVNAVGAG